MKLTPGMPALENHAGGTTLSGKFETPWSDRRSCPLMFRGKASRVVMGEVAEVLETRPRQVCWERALPAKMTAGARCGPG